MPDYLVIDVTGDRSIASGGRVVRNAATPQEAVATLFTDHSAYAYSQEFAVFRLADRTRVKVEMSKTVKALDAKDQTGLTVLGKWGEAELEQLKAARAATP